MHPLWPQVEEHLPRMWRTVRAYERNPAAQDDLMQEVLLAVWQGLPRLRDATRLVPFMLRIAHNLGASHVRRAVRAPARLQLDDEIPADEQPDPANTETRWLLNAVRQLPLPQRQVLLLQLEGFEYKEIAEVLGISIENVGVRTHRARKALQVMNDGHR